MNGRYEAKKCTLLGLPCSVTTTNARTATQIEETSQWRVIKGLPVSMILGTLLLTDLDNPTCQAAGSFLRKRQFQGGMSPSV